MDWDKLRVFHAVAEAGSFTHAGELLNLSQSAVSRQIRGAVNRNRARRRLREAYRNRSVPHPIDTSAVLIARTPALTGSFPTLVHAVDDVLRQLGRLRARGEEP